MLAARPANASNQHSRDFTVGLLSGLAPLGVLSATLLLTAGLTAVVRGALITQSYDIQHAVPPLVFGAGILTATIGAAASAVRVFARMRRWQAAGAVTSVRGSRWAVLLTALLLLIPVALAIVLPQHPAVAP